MVKLENGLYVGCGLTYAPKHFKREVEDLKDSLRVDYKILDFVGSKPATPGEVYDWDIKQCVGKCDAMLAIVDHPSIGLGWEMAIADYRGIPTLLVARIGREVSRLVLGAAEVLPSVEFERYEDLWEVPEKLEQFLGEHLLSDYLGQASRGLRFRGLLPSSRRMGWPLRLVGGQAVTYGQLFDLSRRLAAGLKRDGFQPGDRVFLLAPLNARVLAVVLAVMRLGGAVVVADPGSGRDILWTRLKESDAKWLLISPRLYALRHHPILLRFLRRRRPEIPDIFGVKLPE